MVMLIVAQLCAAVIAPVIVRLLGRRALLILALFPASSAVCAALNTAAAFSDTPPTWTLAWVPGLHLALSFRLDMLSWLMTLIVGGVGAVVMVYASQYFSSNSPGLGRFAGVFVGFAAAMLGVVTVDHTMGLYMFWELTSVLSFLLIGHHFERSPARAAARQALLLTTSGSLAMFGGFVILGEVPGGSYRISELVENAASGTLNTHAPTVIVAGLLVLAGAFSKSALFPFSFWLPGAMAAPTPVSAYLHAAAMVKAGIYLMARLTPGFVAIPGWRPVIVCFGLVTLLQGGWRALRQYDLKLVLAQGTVSQLGLMSVAIGYGTAASVSAGVALLVAHAAFKSTLFLTVGTVEHATGTRDLRELNGVGRQMPLLATCAALAALSMAGIPFLAGYLGKEALIAHLLEQDVWGILVLVGVAVGSAFTVAYSWRAWWGLFARRRVESECIAHPQRPLMIASVCVLSLGALLGLAPHTVEHVSSYGVDLLAGSPHIAWWSGIGPLLVTLSILAAGAVIAYVRIPLERLQSRMQGHVTMVEVYSWSLRELEILSAQVTRLAQRGSLPWDLSVIAMVLLLGGVCSISVTTPTAFRIRWADSALEVCIGVFVIIAAILTARSRRRMRAVLSLSAVGLGVALLYAVYGAPDLALTQIAVEAVSIVVFVLVLRKLPPYFSNRPLQRIRWSRLAIAVLMGVGTVMAGIIASSARIHEPISTLMPDEAFSFGNGTNIVNVILVDIRAWDTVGELSVLLVIATGVASLIFVNRPLNHQPAPAPVRRAITLSTITSIMFPTMLVLSLWLLLIGHNNPGGGFVGGVVAGLAFLLRYLEDGASGLERSLPMPPGRILGLGLFIAGLGAVAPVAFGNAVLQSTPVTIGLGLLGELHFTTAMVLDIGVYVLVIGLVAQLMTTTGAEIDHQAEASTLSPSRGVSTGKAAAEAMFAGRGAAGKARTSQEPSVPHTGVVSASTPPEAASSGGQS